MQAVASSPADNAPRVVAVEEGKALANSFRQTHQMLADVKAGIVLEAEQEAALLSELAIQSAKNNSQYSPRDKEHLVISYLIPETNLLMR